MVEIDLPSALPANFCEAKPITLPISCIEVAFVDLIMSAIIAFNSSVPICSSKNFSIT